MSHVAKFEKVPGELSGEVLVHRLCETIVPTSAILTSDHVP